jgi:hypothetical protein
MGSCNKDDSDLKLFAKQERIYPKRVSGLYRNLKWIAMIVCLAIYYGVPFLRWDRGDNAPNQAVLIDLELIGSGLRYGHKKFTS